MTPEERWQLLMENVREYAICGVDPDGKIFEWSAGAERIFGYSADEVVGRDFCLLFTPELRKAGKPEQELREAAETGDAKDETWHLRKSGERFYASGFTTALRDADGNLRGYAKIARDLTERMVAEAETKRLNEELRTAHDAALQMGHLKTRFLANVSHELRTPLTAIIGYAEMLEEELADLGSERMAGDLLKIRQSAKHLMALITDILDLSRVEAGRVDLHYEQINVFDLAEEMVNTVMPLADRNGNTIVLECRPGTGFLLADELRLRQILLNLLSNAAKFTRNGTVTLACERYQNTEHDWFHFRVSDTGPGLAPDEIDKLFEPFEQFSRDPAHRGQGNGLGLAISRIFCQMMGGEIVVENTSSAGTTFLVRLPDPRG